MGFERSSGKEEMSDPDNYSEWKRGSFGAGGQGEIDALIRELQQKEEQREQTKEYWIKKIAFQLLSEVT